MDSFQFFKNVSCEYYPCHFEGQNCLFCFCPLFRDKVCPGTPRELPSGKRDCSYCDYPHKKENYFPVIRQLGE